MRFRPWIVGVLVNAALFVAPKGWSISLHATADNGQEITVRCRKWKDQAEQKGASE